MHISVRAMKFPPTSDVAKVELAEPVEWVSFDDIRCRIEALSGRLPPVQISQNTESTREVAKNRRAKSWSCCLCSCFSWSRKRDTKSRQGKDKNGRSESKEPSSKYICEPSADKQHVRMQMVPLMTTNAVITPSNNGTVESRDSCGQQTNVAKLRTMAEYLQQKSAIVYETVAYTTSDTFTRLVKYFEQTRGTLVLNVDLRDVDGSPGVAVVNICMRPSHIVDLERDHNSGALQRDLENIIVNAYLLSKIPATAVQLQTNISREELGIADRELAT